MSYMSISWSKTGSVASMLSGITIEDEANDGRTRCRCNPQFTRPSSSPTNSHRLPANNRSLGEEQWPGFRSRLYKVSVVPFRLFCMLLFKVQLNIRWFAESRSRGNTIIHILWIIFGLRNEQVRWHHEKFMFSRNWSKWVLPSPLHLHRDC